ncbi:hypothetical protein ABW20_dc0105469 [Dactylellina cionopaga]|nr:hypothetical protein ABW20_dc0105469 [Dactylellina cionopaga]
MPIEPFKTYLIVNAQSGTILDLAGDGSGSITGWERNAGDNQKWELTQQGDDWLLRNIGSDGWLATLGEDEPSDDYPVIGSETPQPWTITETSDNTYRILVPGTTFNVDLGAGSEENGTAVSLWDHNDESVNQTWIFEEVNEEVIDEANDEANNEANNEAYDEPEVNKNVDEE